MSGQLVAEAATYTAHNKRTFKLLSGTRILIPAKRRSQTYVLDARPSCNEHGTKQSDVTTEFLHRKTKALIKNILHVFIFNFNF
jgi:hypothetical protein